MRNQVISEGAISLFKAFLLNFLLNILWSKSEIKIVTFTKDYAVGFPGVDLNIPKQSWNFLEVHPGHSNCIMESVGEWIEHKTFAEVLKINLNRDIAISGVQNQKKSPSAFELRGLIKAKCL
jgi:hypothetical protein